MSSWRTVERGRNHCVLRRRTHPITAQGSCLEAGSTKRFPCTCQCVHTCIVFSSSFLPSTVSRCSQLPECIICTRKYIARSSSFPLPLPEINRYSLAPRDLSRRSVVSRGITICNAAHCQPGFRSTHIEASYTRADVAGICLFDEHSCQVSIPCIVRQCSYSRTWTESEPFGSNMTCHRSL